MGINDLFNSNRNSENDNNQIQNSSDIAMNNSDNKKEINNKEDLLSNKEFKQYYITKFKYNNIYLTKIYK